MNIWADTYALVCIQKPVARGTGDREGPGEGSNDMATTAANSLRVGGGIALTEVQRLSIALMMHRGLKGSKHLDFTYAHNACKSCCSVSLYIIIFASIVFVLSTTVLMIITHP